MSSPVIEILGVDRSFGRVAAVRDLTLRVAGGSIYGLLGDNGAGKTTTLRMLAGLLWPDRGDIRVGGVRPADVTIEDRRAVGYVSEKQMLPPLMRAGSLIAFCAGLYPEWDAALVDRLLRRVRIDPRQRVGWLSGGTARKLSLLLALAQRPNVLLLDGPAAGLDAVAGRELLDELLDVVREGDRTVFLSSHLLSHVERVADEIGIIADGHLKVSESLDHLKETVKRVRFFDFPPGRPRFQAPDAFRIVGQRDDVLVTMRVRENAVPRLAAEYGCQYEIGDLNLEDIFVDIAGQSIDRGAL